MSIDPNISVVIGKVVRNLEHPILSGYDGALGKISLKPEFAKELQKFGKLFKEKVCKKAVYTKLTFMTLDYKDRSMAETGLMQLRHIVLTKP